MEERIQILLAKKLSGEATAAELRELEQWASLAHENREAINSTESSWKEVDSIFNNGPAFDKNAAWQKISGKITIAEEHDIQKNKNTKRLWLTSSITAAAILLIGLFIFRGANINGHTEILADNGSKKVILPDNSEVQLFKGSSISYAKSFDEKDRNITLKGKAFFNVARNEQMPFIIDANSAEVEVLGTSFYVESGSASYVAVVTGKVSMTAGSAQQQLILTPGETGMLSNGSMIEEQGNADDLMYWKTGEIHFSYVTLSQVVERLDKIFSEDIRLASNLNEQAAQQKINISFKQQSVEAILQELCLVSKCRLLKEDNRYTIDTQ